MRVRTYLSILLALLLSLALAGCGGGSNSSGAAGSGNATATPAAPAVVDLPVAMDLGVQEVQLTAGDTMKYNGNRFTVRTGQPVRIILQNLGQTSREIMAHDVVVLMPGADVLGFDIAAGAAKDHDYRPPDLMNEVVASTPLAGPGQTVEADFTAPAPGAYPFLCSFPGHYAAGMKGTMVVTP
jgi:uncharacterized cupredoxin-like copper-binding protein